MEDKKLKVVTAGLGYAYKHIAHELVQDIKNVSIVSVWDVEKMKEAAQQDSVLTTLTTTASPVFIIPPLATATEYFEPTQKSKSSNKPPDNYITGKKLPNRKNKRK